MEPFYAIHKPLHLKYLYDLSVWEIGDKSGPREAELKQDLLLFMSLRLYHFIIYWQILEDWNFRQYPNMISREIWIPVLDNCNCSWQSDICTL